jgi:hypothetical protein
LKVECLGGTDDLLPVELQEGQLGALAAGGEEYGLRFESDRFAIWVRHLDLVPRKEFAGPVIRCDSVFLEQERDPAGQFLDHLVLAGEHGGEVEPDPADRDPVGLQFVQGGLVQLGRVEQGLARDAPDVQACPAKGLPGPLLDARHLHLELRGPDRGRVPTRPTTNHDKIERIGHTLSKGIHRHSVSQKKWPADDTARQSRNQKCW